MLKGKAKWGDALEQFKAAKLKAHKVRSLL
jgi:hypothetical protein